MNQFFARHRLPLVFAVLAPLSFLPVIIPALTFRAADVSGVVALLYDDAYYYLQIAYNLAHFSSASFDGTTLTNGYQPLWLLVLTLLAKIVGPDKTLFFWTVVILVYLLALFPVWMAPRLVRGSTTIKLYALILMAVLVFRFNAIYVAGMETVLTPFFLLYILRKLTAPADMLDHAAHTGFVLAFAFLVRIDTAAMGPVYILFDFLLNRRALTAAYLGRLAALTGPLLLTGLSYVVINQYLFGSPVPVSGLAKAMDTTAFNNFGIIYQFLAGSLQAFPFRPDYLLVLFWGGVILVEAVRHIVCGRLATHLIPLGFLFCCLCIQYGYYACFSGWSVWPWYLYQIPFILFYVIFRTVTSLLLLGRHLFPALAVAAPKTSPLNMNVNGLIQCTVVAIAVGYLTSTKFSAGARIADPVRLSYAKLNVQQCDLVAGKVVAFGDRAGSLGYWCPTQVVQTEGLVMSRVFLQAREARQGEAWIDQHYDVDLYIVDRDQIPIRSDMIDTFIVVDPIQGRTASRTLMYFCFPRSALLQETPSSTTSRRFIFDYAKKTECSSEDEKMIEHIISSQGIRRYSLQSEYGNSRLRNWLENLDLQLAKRH